MDTATDTTLQVNLITLPPPLYFRYYSFNLRIEFFLFHQTVGIDGLEYPLPGEVWICVPHLRLWKGHTGDPC